jgi:hypothetical protein
MDLGAGGLDFSRSGEEVFGLGSSLAQSAVSPPGAMPLSRMQEVRPFNAAAGVMGPCGGGWLDPDVPSPAAHAHVLADFPGVGIVWVCIPHGGRGLAVNDFLVKATAAAERGLAAHPRDAQAVVLLAAVHRLGDPASTLRLVVDNETVDGSVSLIAACRGEVADRARLRLVSISRTGAASARRRRSMHAGRRASISSLDSPGSVGEGRPAFGHSLVALLADGGEGAPRPDLSPSLGELTGLGYATTPSGRELALMSERQLAAVHDFAVTRAGHGAISWPGDTDVRRMRLERTLRIEDGDIRVYGLAVEGAEPRPQPGTGLNKRAVISVFNITPELWSVQAGAGADPRALERLLREHTASMGAEWVGYDAVQGSWTFEVAHL